MKVVVIWDLNVVERYQSSDRYGDWSDTFDSFITDVFVEQLGKVVTFTLGTDWKVKKGTAQDFKVYIKNNFANTDSSRKAVCHALRIKCLQAMSTGNECKTGVTGTVLVGGYTSVGSTPLGDIWFTKLVSKKVDVPNNEYVSYPGAIQITTANADTYSMEAELLVSSRHDDCEHTGDTEFESAGTERFTIEVR